MKPIGMNMARAKAIGVLDQEVKEMLDWARNVLSTQPDLLTAFQQYTETSTDITGTEVTPAQMALLKRFSHIGFGLVVLRLSGQVTI